jgi:hypothetical protein
VLIIPILNKEIGTAGLFIIFTFVTILSLPFIKTWCLETRNKTEEEIMNAYIERSFENFKDMLIDKK